MNQRLSRLFPNPVAPLLIRVALCLALVALPATAGAASPEDGVGGVFHDGVYGGAVGALVGTALLAFVDRPGDHLDYISNGAAVGVLVGVAWGAYSVSRPYAYWQDGRVRTGMPLPELRVTTGAADALHSTPSETTVWWRLLGVRY